MYVKCTYVGVGLIGDTDMEYSIFAIFITTKHKEQTVLNGNELSLANAALGIFYVL